jgi:hypothetical protein
MMDSEPRSGEDREGTEGNAHVDQVASAEEWLEERIPVEPGGTLYVDLDRGSVEVRSHDRDEVWIEANARGWSSGLVLFTVERSANDVQLDGSIDHWMPSLLGRPRIEVRCTVPREFAVEVETGGGRIEIERVSGRVFATTRGSRIGLREIGGPALLRTSGGSIRVQGLGGDLRAKTSGGRISIEQVEGDVEARTSGGSIDVEDVRGQIDATTSGGSIRARFVAEPWGRLETSGGSIKVQCDTRRGFEVDARSSGGSVKLEPRLDPGGRAGRNEVRGTVNGGGPPIVMRTSGGSIKLGHR